ncbi:uncharacterized protein [Triticum aestivum]|uniref:uncharacterized protein isoform X1 n=1 Tax=Triticum aestivum TaxID=4565 RepID=UPI001D019C8C|nr:uncharacterized protein LOC123132464 isoform X1 [Triticum aestivum]
MIWTTKLAALRYLIRLINPALVSSSLNLYVSRGKGDILILLLLGLVASNYMRECKLTPASTPKRSKGSSASTSPHRFASVHPVLSRRGNSDWFVVRIQHRWSRWSRENVAAQSLEVKKLVYSCLLYYPEKKEVYIWRISEGIYGHRGTKCRSLIFQRVERS